MSVQRYIVAGRHLFLADKVPMLGGEVVIKEADHARIVAEMERQHAAALAGRNAETPIRGEHDPLCFPAIRDVRMGDWGPSCFTCQVIGMARAAAPRTLTRDGWWPFGSFVDYDFPLEFDGEGEDGLPIWERPDKSRLAPRTLTADDPGYHSQRCLHCDHIRATHTLTAHGCIGHALPGRPGADCPCAEFIHDGEAQQAEPEWDKPYEEQSDAVKAGLAKIAQAALHDGEATPEVKPCSTCGEPVAYLTARPGWAGGWLHHPARPLDGHPAAIDEEATP